MPSTVPVFQTLCHSRQRLLVISWQHSNTNRKYSEEHRSSVTRYVVGVSDFLRIQIINICFADLKKVRDLVPFHLMWKSCKITKWTYNFLLILYLCMYYCSYYYYLWFASVVIELNYFELVVGFHQGFGQPTWQLIWAAMEKTSIGDCTISTLQYGWDGNHHCRDWDIDSLNKSSHSVLCIFVEHIWRKWRSLNTSRSYSPLMVNIYQNRCSWKYHVSTAEFCINEDLDWC